MNNFEVRETKVIVYQLIINGKLWNEYDTYEEAVEVLAEMKNQDQDGFITMKAK